MIKMDELYPQLGIVKDAGKEVISMSDGCMDAYADDVMACGARGIISEPYTDYRAIARKHTGCFLAGEGNCLQAPITALL